MFNAIRLPLLAALGFLTIGAGRATAQTVYVRHAPPGRPVEVLFNQSAAGKGTADAGGDAKIALTAATEKGIDANVFVDTCEAVIRILISETGRTIPAPESGCERRDIQGLYFVRPEMTLVVSLGGAAPSLLLVKGNYTPPTPEQETRNAANPEEKEKFPTPTGLAPFFGVSFNTFRDAGSQACGNVADCTVKDSGLGFAAGGVFWLKPWLGAEAMYLRPLQVKASRSGTDLQFDSTQKTDIIVLGGKVAAPLERVRLYGTFGAAYHQSQIDSSETVGSRTVTVDGVDQTIPGGTQTFRQRTQGWSIMYGGGAEIWLKQSFTIFAELDSIRLEGKTTQGEGVFSDRLTSLVAGVRVRIGKKGSSQ